jgi:hypothetical protein
MEDDKEKSIIEKLSDAVKGVVDVASTAATKAMEQPEPDPQQVARTANEQLYIPEATDAAAMPAPLIAAPKASKKNPAPSMSGRITPIYDFPVPDSLMPFPKKRKRKAVVKKAKSAVKKNAPKKSKKTAKKSPRSRAAKKNKSAAGRNIVGKKRTSKKVSKKKKAKRS